MQFIPTYVYVLLCVLVYLGARRCYPRTTRPERLLVFPLVFLGLGLASLNRLFPNAAVSMQTAALGALAIGAWLGWIQASRWDLRFDVTDARIKVRLPGDPSLLVTLLISFAIEFATHYALAVHTPSTRTTAFELLSFTAWAALAGMPLGRSINVLARAIQVKDRRDAAPTLE